MSFDLKLENNDLSIGTDGSVKIVMDNDKLLQDVLKIILTPQGSNRFYKWYGSAMSERIIGTVLGPFLTEVEITRSIEESLNNLMFLQQGQSKYQYVSAPETIAAINDIYSERAEEDPRLYNIFVSVFTKKLTLVETTFQLRL
jgi:hypothetical protein